MLCTVLDAVHNYFIDFTNFIWLTPTGRSASLAALWNYPTNNDAPWNLLWRAGISF